MTLLSLLACTAPPLHVEAPSDPVAGDTVLHVHSDRAVTLERTDAPPVVVEPGDVTLDTRGWPDGAHTLTLTASRWPLRTVQTVTIHTDNRPPACVIDARASSVRQGGTLPVLLRCDEPFTATLEALDRARTVHVLPDGTHRALIGVPIRTAPGAHPLRLQITDLLGNTADHTLTARVDAVDWPFTGKLPMARRKMHVEPAAITEMRTARDAVYATVTPDALWDAPFALPAAGTHTSAFGSYREYPDGSRNHHDAEDIARRRGTPVYAPAPGIVALAAEQAIHGNAVLLDHGHGVVSLYSHFDRLEVELGQRVQVGDLLGAMGSTGRTTGPHLHWGVVVDGVPVDPMAWTREAFTPAEVERWLEL